MRTEVTRRKSSWISLLLFLFSLVTPARTHDATTTTVSRPRRYLKGLIFDGAPGTFHGTGGSNDASADHNGMDPSKTTATTEGILVGHFDYDDNKANGTVLLDSQTMKEIGQRIEDTVLEAEKEEERQHQQPTETAEEVEEDLAALVVGSFLGSFVAVTIFLVLLYRWIRPGETWKPWLLQRHLSLSSTDGCSDNNGDGDDNSSLCTIDCSDENHNSSSNRDDGLPVCDLNNAESYHSARGGRGSGSLYTTFSNHIHEPQQVGDEFEEEGESPCQMLQRLYEEDKNVIADGEFLSYMHDYYERRLSEFQQQPKEAKKAAVASSTSQMEDEQNDDQEPTSTPITFSLRRFSRRKSDLETSAAAAVSSSSSIATAMASASAAAIATATGSMEGLKQQQQKPHSRRGSTGSWSTRRSSITSMISIPMDNSSSSVSSSASSSWSFMVGDNQQQQQQPPQTRRSSFVRTARREQSLSSSEDNTTTNNRRNFLLKDFSTRTFGEESRGCSDYDLDNNIPIVTKFTTNNNNDTPRTIL